MSSKSKKFVDCTDLDFKCPKKTPVCRISTKKCSSKPRKGERIYSVSGKQFYVKGQEEENQVRKLYGKRVRSSLFNLKKAMKGQSVKESPSVAKPIEKHKMGKPASLSPSPGEPNDAVILSTIRKAKALDEVDTLLTTDKASFLATVKDLMDAPELLFQDFNASPTGMSADELRLFNRMQRLKPELERWIDTNPVESFLELY